jgi:hypothetical protein
VTIKKDFDKYWRKEEAEGIWTLHLDPVTVREIAEAAYRTGHKAGSAKAKKKERTNTYGPKRKSYA